MSGNPNDPYQQYGTNTPARPERPDPRTLRRTQDVLGNANLRGGVQARRDPQGSQHPTQSQSNADTPFAPGTAISTVGRSTSTLNMYQQAAGGASAWSIAGGQSPQQPPARTGGVIGRQTPNFSEPNPANPRFPPSRSTFSDYGSSKEGASKSLSPTKLMKKGWKAVKAKTTKGFTRDPSKKDKDGSSSRAIRQ